LNCSWVDIYARNEVGHNALHCTARRGQPAILRRILEDGRINPSYTDLDDNSTLHLAVKGESREYRSRNWSSDILELLLDDGRLDPNGAGTANRQHCILLQDMDELSARLAFWQMTRSTHIYLMMIADGLHFNMQKKSDISDPIMQMLMT
jgi:ankyrin repeat protein